MSKIVVFGASGMIGAELVAVLRNREVDEVVAAQRSVGVDVSTGAGVADVCAGADAVIDCTNVTTTKAAAAVDFFDRAARTIAGAARDAGVRRVVCLSIVNAADPDVNAKFGYYQGKAAQEEAYRSLLPADVLSVVWSAQWYELGGQMLQRARLGPVALVPHMRCAPLAAAEAAQVLADAALAERAGDVTVSGPQVLDLADVSKEIARRDGAPRWVIAIPFGGKAFRDGRLVANNPTVTGRTTFAEWIDGHTDPRDPEPPATARP